MNYMKPSYPFLPPHVTVKAAPRDLTGIRFTLLVALRCVGKCSNGSLLWMCKCDCGKKLPVPACRLTTGKRHSCGCYRSKQTIERLKTHPVWNTGKTYTIKGTDDVFSSRKAWNEAVKKAFGDRCQNCGWDKAMCDAHHKIERKNGGLNTINNGIVLCPNCHRFLHQHGILP